MKKNIYTLAMYEIVEKIIVVCPGDGSDMETSEEGKLAKDVFSYIDKLPTLFPEIDADTYCMIVCGAIMQFYVAEFYFDVELLLRNLTSDFVNEKTMDYFRYIDYALSVIGCFRYFDSDRPICDWPDDFHFENEKEAQMDFIKAVLTAIHSCPEYSYAYCLLDVFYLDPVFGVVFDFVSSDEEIKEAFVKSHMYLGDDLFCYLTTGNFDGGYDMTYTMLSLDVCEQEETEEKVYVSSDIDLFVHERVMSVDDLKEREINSGYFRIDNKLYPAGIPFSRYYETNEFYKFLDENVFYYIPKEGEGNVHLLFQGQNEVLIDQGEFKIEYKSRALFRGLQYCMPLTSCLPQMKQDYLQPLAMRRVVCSLFDACAEEMNKLAEANRKLEKVNYELEEKNNSLKRHIRLNQELVRNLSHSSANYLNSNKLAQTGIELNKAEQGNPTIEKLHLDGLSLLLQSEQEMYLARQLNSLVWRCSANIDALTTQITSGLSKEKGVTIIAPIEFALKTVLARVLFREDDRRGEFIRGKFEKTDKDITKMQSAFMLDILAKDDDEGKVIEWWQQYVGEISLSMSEVWKRIFIVKDKAFYDLITEILTEQVLNALSHGNICMPIFIELGQAEEFKGIPRWTYVLCRNSLGDSYLGGRGVGISTLNETICLLNGNKRGVDYRKDDDLFESKVWVLANLVRPV